MSFRKLEAFSIPVFYGTLGEQTRELNKALVKDIFDYTSNNSPQKRSGVDIYQTPTGLEDYYESFVFFKRALDDMLVFLPPAVGADSYRASCTQFWANIDRSSHGFNMPHSHSAKYPFSLVYFPSSGILDEGTSTEKNVSESEDLDVSVGVGAASHPGPGNLVLLDPLEFCKSALVPGDVKRYPYWGLPLCITPKEGTVVIFPSYLPHMVTPTKQDNLTRISIAVNINFEEISS